MSDGINKALTPLWIWKVWNVWEEPVGSPPLHALLPPTHGSRNLSMEPLDFIDDGGGKWRRLDTGAHTEGTWRLPKAARRITDRLSFISLSWCFASETLKDFSSQLHEESRSPECWGSSLRVWQLDIVRENKCLRLYFGSCVQARVCMFVDF